MGLMDKMMEFMIGRMSKEEKQEMMDKMMEKFFADMTMDDRKKMMAEMMSKMMEGCKCKEGEMPAMPQMMAEMMPKCLKMMEVMHEFTSPAEMREFASSA